jgi:hypothetical protein
LTTRIYDPAIPNPKDPDDERGLPLVVMYIQVVFNKAKKYVLLIKDIKLTTESKLLEKVQVKFGQRGEWDLGWEPEPFMPRSYAHFYHGLPTKYFKHPWYYTDGWETGYDLCQIIDQDENYVAYAAYWPELMSWRVEGIQELTRRDKLTDLSDRSTTGRATKAQKTMGVICTGLLFQDTIKVSTTTTTTTMSMACTIPTASSRLTGHMRNQKCTLMM